MLPDASVLFRSRGEFVEAVLAALAATRRELVLVDRSFADWPLDTVLGTESLAAFLGRDPQARLRLMVGEPDWIERHASRLLALRRRHAAAVECRQVPPSLYAGEGILIGDRRHLVRRAGPDHFRGRLSLGDPTTVEPVAGRYDALWDESTPCLPATTLGL